MKNDKVIVILALVLITIALFLMLDSYGRLQQAYTMCLNYQEVFSFG